MKKSLKSISFWLVILTSFLSIVFALIYNWAEGCYTTDPNFSKTVYDLTHYLEAGFSSLSLFVCYGIIIYSYARYTPDKAKFSFIYLAINIFSYWFVQIILTLGSTAFQAEMAQNSFHIRPTMFYLTNICSAFGQTVIEQVLPAILIAFITYKLTFNGIERITGFISWKNRIQRAMIISTIVIFSINILFLLGLTTFPFLISQSFYITLNAFLDIVIFPLVEKLLFSLILQYLTYMFMYFICNKFGETNGLSHKK